jgi:hypothetical protein
MCLLSINVMGITRAFRFISGLPSVADSLCNEMERIEIVTIEHSKFISLHLELELLGEVNLQNVIEICRGPIMTSLPFDVMLRFGSGTL